MMPALHILIERHWQRPVLWLGCLLWPLSRLFQAAALFRRALYRVGIKKTQRLPCPVVVVGNIHAGGVGKTPVVSALVRGLAERGVQVGIVSRGYGRTSRETLLVNEDDTAATAGDEPLMLRHQTGVPVAVGADRFQAACLLLQSHPETQLVVCDDGLQHYALARDYELAVFPSADVGRQLDVLPNGPLREPLARLQSVNAVLVSRGSEQAAAQCRRVFRLPENVLCTYSQLRAGAVYALADRGQTLLPPDCAGKTVAALAGIARPQRFFDTLRGLGWTLSETKVLPDHAPIQAADLPDADVVLVTEKDAVKLAGQNLPQVWVLQINATLPAELLDNVHRLIAPHGGGTA